MKKLIVVFVAAIAVLTGCSSLETASYSPSSEYLSGVDFRKYSEKGFLVTPEKYNGAYESIGEVRYQLYPASHYKMTKRQLNPDYKPGSSEPRSFDTYAWIDDDINVQMALDSLYQICIDMGADALVNFDRTVTFMDYTGIKNPHTVTGVVITGFAIKRK